ncbi:hypothetical protein Tco_0792891 [Tanacetum coccineum]
MLEIYHCVTSASFTTLARVRQNVAIANGWVIKQEIVGPQSRERNKGPQWQNKRLKLPVMSVELGHYKNGCPERKNQNQVNKQWKGKTCGDSSVLANNVNV